MAGLDAIREKLDGAMFDINMLMIIGETAPEKGLDVLHDAVQIAVKAIPEALALIESEQGEQMRRDNEEMSRLRLLSGGPVELRKITGKVSGLWAILGTPTESEEPGA